MDLQGSLVDTNLKIYPSKTLQEFLKSLSIDNDNVPENISQFIEIKKSEVIKKVNKVNTKTVPIYLDGKDIENLEKIKSVCKLELEESNGLTTEAKPETDTKEKSIDLQTESNNAKSIDSEDKRNEENNKNDNSKESEHIKTTNEDKPHFTTSDVDWLYTHLLKLRNSGDKDVPYLHTLLEGAQIETPQNEILKRNPVLEARCVKLRAQQEAREYRKMTKSVDNVRMKFPEDSISYQLKQVNRQLIAIGQFIISIFAGFLFGFKGVEWMIGQLDFGFRLLMGVMCALIIALAEIYFLAKKLNEELSIPETVQIGGPTIFADQEKYPQNLKNTVDKEHQE